MDYRKSKAKRILNVFIPSGIEMVIIVTIGLTLLLLDYFEVIQEYLGLPREIEFAQTVKNVLDVALSSTLGQGRTETFVVGFFWAIVGLAVYVFLRGISKVMFDLGESIDQRGYVWPREANRYRPLVTVLERTAFQFVAFLVLVYWLLQPLARLLDGPVFIESIGGSQALQYLVWFLMIVGALHIAVVLARLIMLRDRLFD